MSEAAKRFYASPPGEDADAAADYSWELELERHAEAAGVDVTPELGHEPAEDRHHLFIGGHECERCGAHLTELGMTGCPGYMEPTG